MTSRPYSKLVNRPTIGNVATDNNDDTLGGRLPLPCLGESEAHAVNFAQSDSKTQSLSPSNFDRSGCSVVTVGFAPENQFRDTRAFFSKATDDDFSLLPDDKKNEGYGLYKGIYENSDKKTDGGGRAVGDVTRGGEGNAGAEDGTGGVATETGPDKLFNDGIGGGPDEKSVILSKSGIFLLNFFWFGISLMFLVLSVEVVPAQVESLVGQESKGKSLGGMVAGGAALILVVNPVVGYISDTGGLRHPSILKFGKRRPLMVIGCIGLCIGLFGMALSAKDIDFLRDRFPSTNKTQKSGRMDNFTSSEDCHIDLEERRCQPYLNMTMKAAMFGLNKERQQQESVVPPRMSSIQYPVSHRNWTARGYYYEVKGPLGNTALFIIFYLWAQLCLAVISVAYNGLIADMSPAEQRGLNSGVMGGMILFGHVTGAILGVWFDQMGVLTMYTLVIIVMMTSGATTVLTTVEKPARYIAETCSFRKVFIAFFEPLREHDFRWVFFTRFLMQLAVTSITAFAQYWLHDMIYLPNCWAAPKAVAIMLTPLLLFACCSTVPCGYLSDKMKRRKPLVIASGLLMSAISCFMILFSLINESYSYWLIVVFAALYGIGFGAFLSVDYALVLDTLPDYNHAAKDIAIWQLALVLPQAFAAPLAGIIVDLFNKLDCHLGLGYIILFATTAIYFFLSSVFITRIRNVR